MSIWVGSVQTAEDVVVVLEHNVLQAKFDESSGRWVLGAWLKRPCALITARVQVQDALTRENSVIFSV